MHVGLFWPFQGLFNHGAASVSDALPDGLRLLRPVNHRCAMQKSGLLEVLDLV
jgi:hypothetical protein